jgi:hypothetical protein
MNAARCDYAISWMNADGVSPAGYPAELVAINLVQTFTA